MTMTTRPPVPTESIECPLCLGAGKLKRTEILDRLGVKDFARVAQLSAEEAFRLLTQKHNHEQQNVWSRFETELAKRTAEIRERHKDELRSAQSNRGDLIRRVEDCLREVAQLRERNQQLEAEMAKVARVGLRRAQFVPVTLPDLGSSLRQFGLETRPYLLVLVIVPVLEQPEGFFSTELCYTSEVFDAEAIQNLGSLQLSRS